MKRQWTVLAVVTVLIGVTAGFGGLSLVLLLHMVQHLAYGYGAGAVYRDQSFLDGVETASAIRRVLALSTCGVFAGFGWWMIRRFGSSFVSINDVVNRCKRMPELTTIVNDLLQTVTVGLGSPLGREVAPREIGALCASFLSRRAHLSAEESRIMVACGAGAGLAAVYNAPLGGALLALEVLLGTFQLPAAIAAVSTSAIAAYVTRVGLGDQTPYVFPKLVSNQSLIAWSIIVGPVLGFAAGWFANAVQRARVAAPRDWHLALWCCVLFPVMGLIAVRFPPILGNGKGLALLGFHGALTIGAASTLLILKTLAALGSLRAGAQGGLLTPSVAMGALLGTVTCAMWHWISPGAPLGATAVVGAAAFLASSMRMPLTAIVLMMEFTRVDHDFLIPMALAVAGSIGALHVMGATRQEPEYKVL